MDSPMARMFWPVPIRLIPYLVPTVLRLPVQGMIRTFRQVHPCPLMGVQVLIPMEICSPLTGRRPINHWTVLHCFLIQRSLNLLSWQITASDGADTVHDQVMITAKANVPPTAIAGLDQMVNLGLGVVFDGSGSYDKDGRPQPIIYQVRHPTCMER